MFSILNSNRGVIYIYNWTQVVHAVVRSVMYVRNNNDPKSLCWGTPLIVSICEFI